MDGIEIARRSAAEIHDAAVAAGADPWKPYELALAVAAGLGIEVQKLDRGSAILNGAQALYDPSLPLILHEATGSAFQDAFLVSHEIGHVELGDRTERYEARQADPSRASEMPPVGAERVEDYSRRQRREVQMDLFARELLLPRKLARTLHVEDNATAEIIAQRIGAPRATVIQQLLDALLLPQAASGPVKSPVERSLNPQQAEAASHWGAPYLLEAGPGTGKTQTLVGRIQWLLGKDVDPRGILVLTYSNKAAGELFDRIAATNPGAAAAMWIGTFHSFGLDLVRRFNDRLDLPESPAMLDRADAVEMMEAEAPRLGLEHFKNLWDPTDNLDRLLAAISRAKDELVDPDSFERLALSMQAAAVSAAEHEEAGRQLEVARVYRHYETMKAAKQRLDFGDLVTLPVKLLKEHADVRELLSDLYAHVLVDEYQDVNRGSVALLKQLKPAGEHLWAVGDAKQSIYRFRGASSVNLANFAADFRDAETGRLTRNYRSTEEIVRTFSIFATDMNVARGRQSALEAERGPSGIWPRHIQAEFAENEMEAVAEAVEALHGQGIDYRDQAVLCTGNDKLAKFGAALESLGIPVLHLGSIFERPEIKDLLSLLSMLVDKRAMGVVRAATMASFAMPLADAALIIQRQREGTLPAPVWAAGKERLGGLSEAGRAAMASLSAALAGFDEKSQPWDVLSALLLDRTRLAAELARDETIASRAKGLAVWQFMNFVRTLPAGRGLPVSRLLDRIRRLVRLADERDLRQLPASAQGLDAVRLMTVHGSKGLEFRAIHFPGVNADSIPRSPNHFQGIETPDGLVEGVLGTGADVRKAAHLDEQECLFYVGLSRARDRLHLYSAMKKSNGHKRSASQFVERISPPCVSSQVAPLMRMAAGDDGHVDVTFEGHLAIGDSKLATYGSCPRRFFYSHVLEIGGRRVETPFMKMHDAVQKVVDWMVAQDPREVDIRGIDSRLDDAMKEAGVGTEGYAEEYRAIAHALADRLVASRGNLSKVENPGLTLAAGGATIEVRVDDILRGASGVTLVRRVKTGHGTKKSETDASSTALFLAARQAFPNSQVQLIHLADEAPTDIDIDARKQPARLANIQEIVLDIVAGRFPANRNNHSCPRCPAFYICGSLPGGRLEKKITKDVTG